MSIYIFTLTIIKNSYISYISSYKCISFHRTSAASIGKQVSNSIVPYSFIYEFNEKMAQISIALNGRFKVLRLSYLSKSVKI